MLIIKNTLNTNGQGNALLLTDATGAYNGSNLTGYGSPNPEIADFATYVTEVTTPNSGTYLPTGSTYSFDIWDYFPTIDTTLEYIINSSSLGQGTGELLPTGVYSITSTAGTSADPSVLYVYTNEYLVVPKIEQAIYQLLLGNICDCNKYLYLNDMYTLMNLAWSYGKKNEALYELNKLSNALLSLGKTNI